MFPRSARRKLLATLTGAALLCGIAACGDSSDDGTSSTTTTSSAPATTSASSTGSASSGSATSSSSASETSETSTSSTPTKQLTLREGFAGAALSPSTGMYTSLPQALGFWAEEGLTVEIQRVDGTATALSTMAAGQLDVSVISGEPVITADADGQTFVVPYSLSQRGIVTTVVMADSPIQDIAGLAGGTLGVPSLASGAVGFMNAALTDAGVDPASVTFVAVGTGAQAAAALMGGQVAALADTDTAVAAFEAAGASVRILDSPLRDELVMGIVAACTREYLDGNADAVTAWARGVAKATLWMAAHPEDAVRLHYQVYPDERPDGSDEEVIALGVKQIEARLANIVPSDEDADLGALTDNQLTAIVDFLVGAGTIGTAVPIDTFYDGSLIDAINDFDRDAVVATPMPAG